MWRALGTASQPLLGFVNYALGPTKPGPLPVILPTGAQHQTATPEADIQAKLSKLEGKKDEWAHLDCKDRAKLLRECLSTTLDVTEAAAKVMVAAHGSYGGGLGDHRLLWLPLVVGLREYAETLEAGGQPKPNGISQRENGQTVIDIFPIGLEGMFFGGMKGELWIEPGKPPSQGRIYRLAAEGKPVKGSIALVLGAGNQLSVAMLDILHMLIAENAVTICKLNPVLDYLGPYCKQAFKPLIDAGYVTLVYGGAKEGALLTSHPLIDSIHLTGSAATYDAIVWGGKKKAGKPPQKKKVTAELGCVTPYLVVPGQWSQAALEYYADEAVAGMINNSGHNCTKLELLVTAKDWPQREAFVDAVRRRLASVPQRVAWYSGSNQKYAAFKAKHKGAEELGTRVEDDKNTPMYVPWLFHSGLTPEEADTQTENWCGVLQEVAIPGTGADAAQFLEAAVAFANDRCWGTLSASIFAPPDADNAAVQKAVADLRYGAVAVNAPSFACYTLTKLGWGAFPGNTPKDIGSGNCMVHNVHLYDYVQKSVLYSAWFQHPTHLWSTKNRNADATSYYALRFMANPNLLTLTTTALAALRG